MCDDAPEVSLNTIEDTDATSEELTTAPTNYCFFLVPKRPMT
jgi:hypothetical protein